MREGSKSKACQHEAEADSTTLKMGLNGLRNEIKPHAATELPDGPKPAAAAHAEKPEDPVSAELNGPPAEPSDGQPADPGAAQTATEADALGGTSSGVCASGQLSSRPPSTDNDQLSIGMAHSITSARLATHCVQQNFKWLMRQCHSSR